MLNEHSQAVDRYAHAIQGRYCQSISPTTLKFGDQTKMRDQPVGTRFDDF
jgi:hypothetical protein